MKIKVEKPSESELAEFRSCATWSAEPGVFDWEYASVERCYLVEGEVVVTTTDGETVAFGAGDKVTFPAGLKCRWDVRRPVLKHYRFD